MLNGSVVPPVLSGDVYYKCLIYLYFFSGKETLEQESEDSRAGEADFASSLRQRNGLRQHDRRSGLRQLGTSTERG